MSTSFIDQLKAARDRAARGRERDFPMPAVDGWPKFVVRARTLPWQDFRELYDRAQSGDELGSSCDAIARATTSVLIEEGGRLIPFGQWAIESADEGDVDRVRTIVGDATEIGFDKRMADVLMLDTDRARDVVRWMFPEDIPMMAFGGQIITWMQETHSETSRETLGE